MTHEKFQQYVCERFASMEARPEMWAITREAFGLQIVAFVEMLLWPEGASSNTEMVELMRRLFGGLVVSSEPIDAAWARQAVATARGFIEEKRVKHAAAFTDANVRYAATGPGHAAYHDLIAALGGPCRPEIVGWCDVDVDGSPRSALVVTQAWPFLPLGTDPAPIKKAKKYVALIPEASGFRTVEVPPPPSTKAAEVSP